MLVADATTWINHWRVADLKFARQLVAGEVVMHPFVIGELALGGIKDRHKTIASLKDLIQLKPASHEEVMHLFEVHGLYSRGIGYVDLHLLAAALLNRCRLLTADKRLRDCAEMLGIAA